MITNRDFHGPNLGYILELYDRFQDDPDSVDETARRLFQHWKPTASSGLTHQATPNLIPLSKAADLAQAIRSRGYLAASLCGSLPGYGRFGKKLLKSLYTSLKPKINKKSISIIHK